MDGIWIVYFCYVKMNFLDWFYMVIMKMIVNGELLNGVYLFIEDFCCDGVSYCEICSVKFGDCYSKVDDC